MGDQQDAGHDPQDRLHGLVAGAVKRGDLGHDQAVAVDGVGHAIAPCCILRSHGGNDGPAQGRRRQNMMTLVDFIVKTNGDGKEA
ncbi:hypothetical protein D3C72_2113920 [compost metagenome]